MKYLQGGIWKLSSSLSKIGGNVEIEVFLMPAWFPGAVEVGGLIVAEGGPVGPAGDEALLVVRAAVVVLSVAGEGQVAPQQPELGHRDQTWGQRSARYSDKKY